MDTKFLSGKIDSLQRQLDSCNEVADYRKSKIKQCKTSLWELHEQIRILQSQLDLSGNNAPQNETSPGEEPNGNINISSNECRKECIKM